MEFFGELETHLTICLTESKSIEDLRDWGTPRGLKCLHIVLEQGEVCSQPMLTRRTTGKLTGEIDAAESLKNLLIADGFTVSRIKIEAAPWNEDVPQSAAEIVRYSPLRYFESHTRIICDKETDKIVLIETVTKHSAHLSRNALRRREDGLEERFITQRCRTGGYAESLSQLNALLREIRGLGYTVIDVEEEYVVYDSNLEIDAGWIPTKG
ncbi:MAG TPA: hypothetical protein VF599_25055 [Pyrinomonadaceae bacterium]|jgi:hypothetical protein